MRTWTCVKVNFCMAAPGHSRNVPETNERKERPRKCFNCIETEQLSNRLRESVPSRRWQFRFAGYQNKRITLADYSHRIRSIRRRSDCRNTKKTTNGTGCRYLGAVPKKLAPVIQRNVGPGANSETWFPTD